MKTESSESQHSESHHEATKALALAVAGVMAILLIWNLLMMLLY